jgi:hypothetical protein
VTNFTATTKATTERDLKAIVRDLRKKNPDQDGLAVFFQPKEGELFATGFSFDDVGTEAALIKSSGANRAQWEAGKEDSTSILMD